MLGPPLPSHERLMPTRCSAREMDLRTKERPLEEASALMAQCFFTPHPPRNLAVVQMISRVAQQNVRDYVDILYAAASGMDLMSPKYPTVSNKRILIEIVMYTLLRDRVSELDRSCMMATLRGLWCALVFGVCRP